jgi:hypothetical protein
MAKKKPTTKRQPPTTKKGRPKGSRNHQVDHAAVELSRCPKCGSTEREAYARKHVQRIAGTDAEGRPSPAIVRRRTRCLGCGQHRIDRSYEHQP